MPDRQLAAGLLVVLLAGCAPYRPPGPPDSAEGHQAIHVGAIIDRRVHGGANIAAIAPVVQQALAARSLLGDRQSRRVLTVTVYDYAAAPGRDPSAHVHLMLDVTDGARLMLREDIDRNAKDGNVFALNTGDTAAGDAGRLLQQTLAQAVDDGIDRADFRAALLRRTPPG